MLPDAPMVLFYAIEKARSYWDPSAGGYLVSLAEIALVLVGSRGGLDVTEPQVASVQEPVRPAGLVSTR